MQIIETIEDVRNYQLCTGCGVCAALEGERYTMEDVPTEGLRPRVKEGAPVASGDAFQACPGIRLQHEAAAQDPALDSDLRAAWGPVYQVLEGHACDGELRFAASSGGAASALALYCLEQRQMRGVLHTAADPHQPYRNRTVFSRDRADLLAATGSRYAPSSPCAELQTIINADGECVFIGKPCDVAAVQAARKQSSSLHSHLGLTIAFFCAGVPSTNASLQLAAQQGAREPESIRALRYRGKGWPGVWSLDFMDPGSTEAATPRQSTLSYAESWDFLQRHRQWRCYICPDHTGEFADISVGDPWYREIDPGEPGSSLIVVRTQRGQEILQGAIAAGYLHVIKRDTSLLPRSQPDLLAARGNLWARLYTLRLFGAAAPNYPGFALFPFWWRELNFVDKLRSVIGTVKRIYRKRLRHPVAQTR
ncbi:Coenzyme F420 hydrogenase/dehydrogenase, beta subunit C-terminal domain [Microbulbifer bruguierae]|uniref:Coenzyme F420 hydrogenase/dehydrogenase, beta subunit C-terminal domain n=1 Tax=Microbulbifer bruguierae TaxID=3029061 RepID=A0ABY8NKT9_9GAMM|nr:Coenzyme F420 hydrogenase/dehydrogenase, beta subunit C-terminal domain [Microbulbifer bruguierae]WGL18228.1 Coenzyme F420 hydrogenase/dehydrogenase, beta subunit C-terminal domain [Microbulbifer bruguierae]